MGKNEADQEDASYDMQDEIKGYKQHRRSLKKGQSSTISKDFGSASELLPEGVLKEYLRQVTPYSLGESLVAEGADPDSFTKAINTFIGRLKDEVPLEDKASLADEDSAERPIIAVLYEEGKKKLLFADGSEEDVPEEQAEDHEKLDG